MVWEQPSLDHALHMLARAAKLLDMVMSVEALSDQPMMS